MVKKYFLQLNESAFITNFIQTRKSFFGEFKCLRSSKDFLAVRITLINPQF